MNSEGLFTTEKKSEYESALAEVKLYLDAMLKYYFKHKSMTYMTGWRVKGLDSINDKLAKKIEETGSNIDSLNVIKDIAGIRVVFCDQCDVCDHGLGFVNYQIHSWNEETFRKKFYEVVDRYDDKYLEAIDDFIDFLKSDLRYKNKIVDSDKKNYIKHPKKSGYQSHHIFVYASNGYPVEVQFRNMVQHYFAEFEHDRYKADKVIRAKYDDVCMECGSVLRDISSSYYKTASLHLASGSGYVKKYSLNLSMI